MATFKTEGGLEINIREGATPQSVNLTVLDPTTQDPRSSVTLSISKEEAEALAREILRITGP